MRTSKLFKPLARFFKTSDAKASTQPQTVDTLRVRKPLKPFTVGLFYPEKAIFLIRNPAAEHSHRLFEFAYPAEDWLPLTGDWTNTGVMGSGLYDPKTSLFYLRNQDDSGYPDNTVYFGPANAGWLPIVGDWNGDGCDSVGLYDPHSSQFFLNNTGKGGQADCQFMFGNVQQAWLPLAGDWDGDGIDGIGLYDPINSVFYLRNHLSSGAADHIFQFGSAGEDYLPLVGDWDGDGCDSIGLYHLATQRFELRNVLSEGAAESQFTFGLRDLRVKPIALPWNEWQLRDIQSDQHLAERLRGDSVLPVSEALASTVKTETATDKKPLRMGLRRRDPAMKVLDQPTKQ